MLTTEQVERIYDLASQVDGEYVKPLLELSDYLDSLTDDQPSDPVAWTTPYEMEGLANSTPEQNKFAVVWRYKGYLNDSAIPLYALQPGKITSEYHQRTLREAVKAAYARAAEKCREVSNEFAAETANRKGSHMAGCDDCAAAIRAMGESDAE